LFYCKYLICAILRLNRLLSNGLGKCQVLSQKKILLSTPQIDTGRGVILVFPQNKGLLGGVLGLLYMCTFVIPARTSLVSVLGGTLPPFIKIKVRKFPIIVLCYSQGLQADLNFSSPISGQRFMYRRGRRNLL
jgi:hypothetical protein